jgi:choline kinase
LSSSVRKRRCETDHATHDKKPTEENGALGDSSTKEQWVFALAHSDWIIKRSVSLSIGDFCRRGDVKVYAENAFNEKQGAIPLYPMELNGRLCHEIDTPEDLKTVSGMFMRSLQEEEKGGAAL